MLTFAVDEQYNAYGEDMRTEGLHYKRPRMKGDM